MEVPRILSPHVEEEKFGDSSSTGLVQMFAYLLFNNVAYAKMTMTVLPILAVAVKLVINMPKYGQGLGFA